MVETSAKKKSPAKKAVKKAVEKPAREGLARAARTKTVEVYTPGTATTDALKSPKTAKSPIKRAAAGGKKGKSSHPTYKAMVKRAIKDLRPNEKTAVSYIAIQKYIAANYPVSDRYQKSVKQALRAGVAEKKLVQVRASFRLSAKEERGRSRSKKSKRSASKSPSKKASASPSKKKASPKKEKSPSKKTKSPKKSKGEEKSKSPAKVSKKRGASASKEASPKRAKKVAAPKRDKKAAKPKAVPIGGQDSLEETAAVPRPLGLVNDFLWQYWDNRWCDYDATASDVVESTYQGYLANRGDTDVRSVHSGSWEYQVDFMAMKQTNIGHANHTTRNIRRVPVAK